MATKVFNDFNFVLNELIQTHQMFTVRISQLMSNYKIIDDILKNVPKKDAKDYAATTIQLIDNLIEATRLNYHTFKFYRYEIKKNRRIFD